MPPVTRVHTYKTDDTLSTHAVSASPPPPAMRGGRADRVAPASAPAGRVSGHSMSQMRQQHAFLYQQLQDLLHQQSQLERERQESLISCRRELRAIYDENASLRTIISEGESRRRHNQHTGRPGVPATVTLSELESLTARINIARKKTNRLMYDMKLTERDLALELGTSSELKKELETPLDPAALLLGSNRPLYVRMMRLERRLNDVLCRQGNVAVVLRNYRFHEAALRREANQYDVREGYIELECQDRHRDHLQMLSLYDGARAAYFKAVEKRDATRHLNARLRTAKEKALQQKQQSVNAALAQTQREELRCVALQQRWDEEMQLLEAAETTQARLYQLHVNARSPMALLRVAGESRVSDTTVSFGGIAGASTGDDVDEKVAAYKSAFEGMMRGWGVSTLDALVEEYQKEMDAQAALHQELDYMREAEAALMEEVRQLRKDVEESQYCVGVPRITNSTVAEVEVSEPLAALHQITVSEHLEREINAFLDEAKVELTTSADTASANSQLLVDVATQLQRLSDLVADYRQDIRLPPIDTKTAASAGRSSTLPLHAAVLAQKLLSLADDTTRRGGEETAVADGEETASIPVPTSAQLVVPANNRRVHPRHERHHRFTAGQGDVATMSSSAARVLLLRQQRAAVQQQRNQTPSSFLPTGIEHLNDKGREDDAALDRFASLNPAEMAELSNPSLLLSTSDDSHLVESASMVIGDTRAAGGGDAAPSLSMTMKRGSIAFPPPAGPSPAAAKRGGRSSQTRATNAAAVDYDMDEPLGRKEVKHISMMIQERRHRNSRLL